MNHAHKENNGHPLDPTGLKWREHLKDINSHISYFNLLRTVAGVSTETIKNYVHTLAKVIKITKTYVLTDGNVPDIDQRFVQSLTGAELSLKEYKKKIVNAQTVYVNISTAEFSSILFDLKFKFETFRHFVTGVQL